jgi:CheY-like chemotaxis protein
MNRRKILTIGFKRMTMIAKPQYAPLKILLADDDKDDRYFFMKVLQEISNETDFNTVDDGEKLMDYLTKNLENLPDILFLDLNMPRQNGFECLIDIKGNTKLNDIYVIMFSTSFPRDEIYEIEMINRLYKMGAQDYISKSADIANLKQTILLAINKAVAIKLNDS